jgi:uncharacterized protein (TIGR00730 family)
MEKTICVYCASSQQIDPAYHDAARELGATLAKQKFTIVYGGGALGSMGALAEGAISQGGKIIGIIPRFMVDLEWGHRNLTELQLVEDMRTRKHEMLSRSQGVVTLPGGTGTLEELFEAMSLKRLGLYSHPIILVNTRNYFAPLLEVLRRAIAERFMAEQHADLWQTVDTPEEVPAALAAAPPWSPDARRFAVQR